MITDFQNYIAKSRYARYLPDKKRRETWEETVERYVNYVFEKYPNTFPKEEIRKSILNFEVMPSMRAMMTAGKALERDAASAYNCSYLAIDDQRAFDEAMYLLMVGTGVGYSVERQFISKLPVISEEFFDTESVIVVKDSRIGWASSLKELISLLYQGLIPKWDLSLLRPAGAPLKTFGGRSSGPAPLEELFNFFVTVFKNASGRKLNSLECNDLMCKIAESVVVGGVRRSACICLTNLSDDRMRSAKSGQWWIENGQRSLANISVAYTEKPEIGQFMEEWLSLYNSKSGERGIFNRVAALKKIKAIGRRNPEPIREAGGMNPCLTGDTLVYVADGRGAVSIKKLAEEGKDVNVFCFDEKNNVVVRTMRNPRITNEKAEVYKITLDDGSIIRTTENHKFLTKTGVYKEVRDLIIGESLDIITKFESSIKDIFPNANNSGFINEEIRVHAMILTKELGRRFSTDDWKTYADENDLPKSFSKWREDHLGGIRGLSKSCALELGYEHIDCDPIVIKQYKEAVDSGYDAFINGNEIFITKKCEVCGKEFSVSYKKREIGICSVSCDSRRTLDNENKRKNYLDSTKNEKRNNHKVLSVEFDGYATVYNGTVDEYHNFFVGAFEGETTKGKKTLTFLNNLQCGEIVLRSCGFCNLSEVVIRPDDTLETILEKVRIATIIGTHQATFTNFRYLRSIWKKNADEERLLGVSLTGIMDHEIFSGKKGFDILAEWLTQMKKVAIDVNKELSLKLGINPSVSITTTKPSGCTTLNTKIKTNEGIKSMAEIFSELTEENIFEKQPSSWITPSKELFVFDENNEKKKITNLFINGMSEIYEIEDENGNCFKFTGEHKLKTDVGWKRVDELSIYDNIISF